MARRARINLTLIGPAAIPPEPDRVGPFTNDTFGGRADPMTGGQLFCSNVTAKPCDDVPSIRTVSARELRWNDPMRDRRERDEDGET